MRQFEGGATRDDADGKPDFEGYLSPEVIDRYGQYMLKHQTTAAGRRASDDWQQGIPKDIYIKSAWRHFLDWWKEHRGIPSREGLEDALCALIFNAMGYLHESLKPRGDDIKGYPVSYDGRVIGKLTNVEFTFPDEDFRVSGPEHLRINHIFIGNSENPAQMLHMTPDGRAWVTREASEFGSCTPPWEETPCV